jgi:hypothetical protein
MKLALRFFPFLSALLMLGCGGSTTPMTNPLNGNAPTLNGSYSFIAGSQIAETNIFTFGGPIQTDANGHVTANFGVTSVAPTNTCFPCWERWIVYRSSKPTRTAFTHQRCH